MDNVYLDSLASVSADATIGVGSKVWGLAQVRENALVGMDCVIGRGVYIGPGVTVGDNCKIQNGAQIYEPAKLGNGVFVGPAAVLTNDRLPRAVNPNGELKGPQDWISAAVIVYEGASIGAGAICVAPVTIGAWSMVAAGSVVTRDVAPFSLVAGVPARHVKWLGRMGQPLERVGEVFVCPGTGEEYIETSGFLKQKEATSD